DGGGIYTLGRQPDSIISHNYLQKQGGDYAAIYLDDNSRYFQVTQNMMSEVPRWLYIPFSNSISNTIQANCSTTKEMIDNGKSNQIGDNQVGLTTLPYPDICQQIIENAGLEAAY